jgi:hypothetical protein
LGLSRNTALTRCSSEAIPFMSTGDSKSSRMSRAWASQASIPSASFPEVGGLISYGVNLVNNYRQWEYTPAEYCMVQTPRTCPLSSPSNWNW